MTTRCTTERATTSFSSKFEIVDSRSIDATSNTDGIDVISTPLGPTFSTGLLVVQDGDNDLDENNFKVVPWDLVAGSANPGLMIETGWSPRGENTLNLPRPSLPQTPAVGAAAAWNVAGAAIATAADDDDGAAGSGEALVMQQGSRILLRFSDLEIPDDAKLRRAHLRFTAAEQGEGKVVSAITGILDDGTETSAVTWAPAPWAEGDSGPYQQTPELSQVIEQILAGGWAPGDGITLAVTANRRRVAVCGRIRCCAGGGARPDARVHAGGVEIR